MVNSSCDTSVCTYPVLILSTLLLGDGLGAPGWEAHLGRQPQCGWRGCSGSPCACALGRAEHPAPTCGARKAAPRPGHCCSLAPKFAKRPLIAKMPHIRHGIDLNFIFKPLAVLPLPSQKSTVGSHGLRDGNRGREASHCSGVPWPQAWGGLCLLCLSGVLGCPTGVTGSPS